MRHKSGCAEFEHLFSQKWSKCRHKSGRAEFVQVFAQTLVKMPSQIWLRRICASVCAKMPPSVVLQVVKISPSVVLQNLWPFLSNKIGQNAAKCRVRVSGVHCVPRRMLDSDFCVVRQIALIVPLGSPSAQVVIVLIVI